MSALTTSVVLIVAAIGVIALALAALVFRYRSAQSTELGSVSHSWVAELRAGEPYDSSR